MCDVLPIELQSGFDFNALTMAAALKNLFGSVDVEGLPEQSNLGVPSNDVLHALPSEAPPPQQPSSSGAIFAAGKRPAERAIDSPPHKRRRENAKRKAKKNESAKERSRRRRLKDAEDGRPLRENLYERRVQASHPVETELLSEGLPVARGAYSAKNALSGGPAKANLSNIPSVVDRPLPVPNTDDPLREVRNSGVHLKLTQLMEVQGFEYLAWDGTVTHPILDSLKRVVVVLVGKPQDDTYDRSTRRLFDKLSALCATTSFTTAESDHARGRFPAVNVGVTIGPGLDRPSRVSVGGHEEMMEGLLGNQDLVRLALHQDASFRAWAPKLHTYYGAMNRRLFGYNPKLRSNFRRSVFCSMAINFPPNVCTLPHRDTRNLPFGWCAIHALGDFNHRAGGHIILWELKLIVEFPPSALILLPSATITHSNVPAQKGDSRASVTQYTGGALFRFVDNGFRTDAALKKEDRLEFEEIYMKRERRWEMGLSLLRKYDQKTKCFV